jgi:hypothetical protein
MTEGIGIEFPEEGPKWAAELGDAGAALIFGARTGVSRVAAASGITVSPDEFWTRFEDAAARPLIDLTREGGLSPHGLALLSDVIGTAVAIRIAHGEHWLTEEDVRNFLPQLVTFENTFIRGCDPT